MSRCSCKLHNDMAVPAAETRCPFCERDFCRMCFKAECCHDCANGSGEQVVEAAERILAAQPVEVPA